MTIRIVQAQEIDPPPGEEPINWILLTDLECRDFYQARQVLELYLCRWEIEVFHRVLKTGCRVEELQLRTGVSIKLAILLYMIVAWRVLYVIHLGRECPELPCSVVFEEAEWHSSWVILKGGLPPTEPRTESDGQNGRFLRWLFGPKERWPSRTKNPLDRVVPSAGFCFLLAANSPSALQRLKSSALQV